MKTNLWARFGLIFAAIALAVLCIYFNGVKGGIDLSGGTDLIYQLNIPKGFHGDPNRLAQQVVDVLKKRVDPKSVRNLVWRVLSGNRIEIQMPLADEKSRQAQAAYQKLVDKLLADNIQPSQINAAMAARPASLREKDIAALAGTNQKRLALLKQLAISYDAYHGARQAAGRYSPTDLPDALLQRLNNTEAAYEQALNAVLAENINVRQLANVLEAIYDTGSAQAKTSLSQLIANHPGRAAVIHQLVAAYSNLRKHSGGLDNPAELERLLRGAGVLDFRIAASPSLPGMMTAVRQLEAKGPHNAITPAGLRWFEIDPVNGKDLLPKPGEPPYYVTGEYQGRHYVLLYDAPGKMMTHSPSFKPWKVELAQFGSDPSTGQPTVYFNLDDAGGYYMGQLTSANRNQNMAILLDGKAITAPSIRGIIHKQGQITLGTANNVLAARSIANEGRTITQILNAGSLPATLQSQPISVQTIGSTLGADNLRAGLRSAVIAVIVVLLFMFTYYTITGAFADIALLMNLLLLMGVMSLLHATFTLPGIAGVVLTLGMAVDANILINERIREELHKGASLWLAVKQGYDKVFWTIFDANLTTSLTSIVLIELGSEDVKGFGITLLIGLAVHMFTALFVTRTLMITAIRTGVMRKIDDLSVAEYFRDLFTFTWLRGRWPFMRVFTLTNFDWIGKRHIFWIVSGLVMISGMVAFWARGTHKYDTEFNGGTQITLHLKPGKTLAVSAVRQRVAALGRSDAALAALRRATVYSVGSKHNEFTIITSIVNPEGKPGVTATASPVQELTQKLEATFADVIAVTRKLSFTDVNVSPSHVQRLFDDGTIFSITKNSLQELIPHGPNVDVSDYHGGVGVVLRNISPPETVAHLTSRIRQMAQEPDFARLQYRPFKVIPLTYAASAAGKGPAPVTAAVVVAVDDNFLYNPDDSGKAALWKQQVAASQWDIVRTALTTSGGLAGVNSFAPQVATEARLNALIAVGISLLLIVAYVWIRFGGIRYGFGVIFSLVHDAIVAVAATVLAVYIHRTAIGHFLLVDNFKINMTMIAAYLTIIGYSVNDTIVIFDRVRENRGRLKLPLTAKLVNDSINQCFGRTIWTTFTVFVVVMILYIWGGQGVHGFAYAMLIGVFTGAYSTLAIASPTLLHAKEAAKKALPAVQDDGQEKTDESALAR